MKQFIHPFDSINSTTRITTHITNKVATLTKLKANNATSVKLSKTCPLLWTIRGNISSTALTTVPLAHCACLCELNVKDYI